MNNTSMLLHQLLLLRLQGNSVLKVTPANWQEYVEKLFYFFSNTMRVISQG